MPEIPKFVVGEVAILQSMDARPHLWNADVTVLEVRWAVNPTDIHGMPQPSAFIYEIDACEGLFFEYTLKKKDRPQIEILEKTTVEVMA